MKTKPWAVVVASGALVGSALAGTGPAVAATDPSALIGAVRPAPVFADADGDRVSDEFEADLLAAAPTDLFEVIVRTNRGGATDAMAVAGPFAVDAELPLIDGFAATMSATQVSALAAHPDTIRVSRNAGVALADDGGLADFGAAAAQTEFGVTGAGVGICVIDSGADPTHEQLDDGKIVDWIDLINGLPVPYDDHNGGVGGHGTHVASIAAGDGVGGPQAFQHRGVAPDADLYVAKAFPGTIPDDIPSISPSSGQESVTIAAIQWCVDQPGVDVISMSFTKTGPTDGTDPLGVAVDNAVAQGKIAIAAAGNDGPNPGFVGSPGAAMSSITVGAVADWSLPITSTNRSEGPFLPAFTSRGPTADGRIKPDLVAPGHSVLAASSGTVAGYVDKSGTSMATPFVAGVAALALERNPSLGHEDVRALLTGTAIDRGPAGPDNDWGWGMIDAYGVVSTADGSTLYTPTAFPTHTVLDAAKGAGAWTYDFTLAADDLDVPIAATMLIDGGPDVSGVFWDPDLQLTLTDPLGIDLDFSNCPLLPDPNDCLGNLPNSGRQELVHALPTVAGVYTLTVEGPAAGFLIDLSHGPVVAPAPEPGPCTTTFTGGVDGSSWLIPGNWSSGSFPLASDVACIPVDQSVDHDVGSAVVRAIVVDGSLAVAAPAALDLTDASVPSVVAGQLALAGSTITTAAAIDLRGTLSGAGTIVGDLDNGGEVAPAGVVEVTGTYRQTADGRLAVDVAGPAAHDTLVVGAAELAGQLAITTTYLPSPGDDVEVLDVGTARTGAFADVTGTDLGPAVHWTLDVTIDAPDVHLVAVAGSDPGPGGGDGDDDDDQGEDDDDDDDDQGEDDEDDDDDQGEDD